MPTLDVDGARQAGYSDEEILDAMASQSPKFDVGKALQSGYSTGDVINFLQTSHQASQPHYLGDTNISSAPQGGLSQWAQDAIDDIRYGGDRTWVGRGLKAMGATPTTSGVSPEISEFMGGPAIGPMKVVKGVGEIPTHPLRAAGDILGGAAQATAPFSAVMGGPTAARAGAAALEAPAALARTILPNVERAGNAIGEVAQAAKGLPVDLTEPGKILVEMERLNKTGAEMPRVAKLLADRIRGGASSIPFEDARDFVSNARVSQGEYNNLTGKMQRLLAQLGDSLHTTIAQTADSAGGLGTKYLQAVDSYRKAIQWSQRMGKAQEWAVKSAITGAAGAAGVGGAYGLYRTLFE